uniref:Porin n=1 Tax=Geobacter sp. (strain M21) TaxID=443144 RepID=C6E1L3_GEOSM
MGIKQVPLLLLCLSMLPAAVGWGAEIHGRSSTQFQSFNNELLGDDRQIELAEYLRLSVTNIDKAGKFSIHGYGRGSQDFTNGEGLNGRLYYFYGDYRDLFDKIDLKIGRQFVNLAAGSAIVDGAQVDLKNVGPVAFTVMGGHDVVFGLNGEFGDASNTVLGMSAYLVGQKATDLELSWFRKYDSGSVTRDIVGGSFKQYLLNSLKVYGNAKYDTTAEAFNEVLGGVKYFPRSDLVFTGEYYNSYATFDTTSIYSIFAVNDYTEGVFRVDYNLNNMLSMNLGYNRQWYGDDGHANVYQAGASFRPIEPLRVNVEYDNRNGYYGSTNGFIIDANYDLNRVSQVGCGFTYDVYQRDSITGEETARRYWLGGKYKVAKNMAVSGRIQDDVNARYDNNVSGRVTVDYDF